MEIFVILRENKVMRIGMLAGLALLLSGGCASGNAGNGETTDPGGAQVSEIPTFDADSAYTYVERLVAFGPRVPNTDAHRKAGDWLAGKMRSLGWEVTEQKTVIEGFDGTPLQTRNILAQLNPELPGRTLLLAHWDSRPWADADPDSAKQEQPVLGANDGASGIGVLMEIARQLAKQGSTAPVDILFVDAEDWGSHDDEDSWAMGTRYFVQNPPKEGYRPSQAILLDMVGSPDARFGYEYFSAQSHPELLQKVWAEAARLGHSDYFHTGFGGAVTDDHVELIKGGIPAIDIIDYRNTPAYQGFDPVWHTSRDDMSNISRQTLRAVGETVMGVVAETSKE